MVIEDAQRFDLYINERKVEPQENSWWLDPAFRRISADGCLVKGRNRVIIRGRKEEDLSIEDAYILGDFAVRIDGKCPLLTEEESECPDISDLRTHGYPFFAGTIVLETEIRIEKRRPGRPYLEFEQLGGTVAQFIVNEKKVGNVFWREYRICVEDELKVGMNEIKIKLTNSLRNLLGPRHWEADEFTGVNPRSFRDYHGWTDEYVGVPLGIEGLRLVWR